MYSTTENDVLTRALTKAHVRAVKSQHSIDKTTLVLTNLSRFVLVGGKALSDGFQIADIAALATLYPDAVSIARHSHDVLSEVRDLDMREGFALAHEVLTLTENTINAFAEINSARSANPDEAFHAATVTLKAVRDLSLVGLATLRDGFQINDVPRLMEMFPHATALAQYAPLSVQKFSTLTLQHKRTMLKLSVDTVFDVLEALQAP